MLTFLKFILSFLIGAAILGCESQQGYNNAMTFLQEGKANGHMNLTSDARASGSIENTFSFGAAGTAVSFDGNIDFGDRVRHVTNRPDVEDTE